MISKRKYLIDCKRQCDRQCRNGKAEDAAVAFYRIYRCLLFFREYKHFAENIVQHQHNHLKCQLGTHFRNAKQTAQKNNAEHFDKHRGETHSDKTAHLHGQFPHSMRAAFKNKLFVDCVCKQDREKDRQHICKRHINPKYSSQQGITSKIYKCRTPAKENIADALITVQFFYKFCHITFLTFSVKRILMIRRTTFFGCFDLYTEQEQSPHPDLCIHIFSSIYRPAAKCKV